MVKSMTAFAQQAHDAEWGHLSVEMKTVNHRYLEYNFRLPELVRDQEMVMRDKIRSKLQRGKIDITVKYDPAVSDVNPIAINHFLIQQLLSASDQLQKTYELNGKLSVNDILRWPGVLHSEHVDLTIVQHTLLQLFDNCLIELEKARLREGNSLAQLLLDRIQHIKQLIEKIKPLVARAVEEQKQKIMTKCQDLQIELEPMRLAQEVVLLAQRADIAEEIDRLTMHLIEMERIIKQGDAMGRRLDFLMQELNRETNTIGSKSTDTLITQTVVDIKVLIEQMREQVQNIE